MKHEIGYEVYNTDIFLGEFSEKDVAIQFAKSNRGDSVVKVDNHTFETLGIVWERG